MRDSDKLILSAYGSHNGGVAMYYKGQFYVVEAERWLNSKNIGICNYMAPRNMQLAFDSMVDWLLQQTDRDSVDVYLSDYMQNVNTRFYAKEMVGYTHHMAHAACSFYQSPFDEALVVSFDGGGNDGYFNVYLANRKSGIKLLSASRNDLGFPYMLLGDYMADIKKEPMTIGNLVYPGKLMGLCSYGEVREEWLPHFMDYYRRFNYDVESFRGGLETSYKALRALFDAIGMSDVEVGENNTRLEGKPAWDIAATTQRAFEEIFFELAGDYLKEYENLPLCLSGGCALNVILNSRLLEERNQRVFIPPNTNDSGIAVGAILWHMQPEHRVDLTYSGLPVMDAHEVPMYLEDWNYEVSKNVSIKALAQLLKDGKIIGVVNGNSEHGSRALGNRSILCNPVGDMKDVLNEKVKHREWYRPFAPVVRLEDVDTYFNWNPKNESRHMTFVATVKDEYKDVIPAVTHEDGTARLQTVTESQNKFLYDLLTEFSGINEEHAVLLNTSFNDNGKPILTRMSDALNLLSSTELDAVYYNGMLISSKQSPVKVDEDSDTILTSRNPGTLETVTFGFGKTSDFKKVDKLTNLTTIVPKPTENGWPEYVVDEGKLYYVDRMREFVDIGDSVEDVWKVTGVLWAKEAITKNFHSAGYVLLVFAPQKSLSLVKGLPTLSDLHAEDRLFVYGDKQGNVEAVLGTYSDVIWFIDHYEAMILSALNDGEAYTDPQEYFKDVIEANPSRLEILT